MKRHQQNPNLSLFDAPYYRVGYPVQTQQGPLVTEYLDRLWQVIHQALDEYGRVFAFRVDLRFPTEHYAPGYDDNSVIERIFASFKAKIRHNRNMALEANAYAHDTGVRYVWCREIGQHGVPHYHLAFFLNYDAYCTLGQYEIGRENLFNRLHEAWASALGLPVHQVLGLVELPESPFRILKRGDIQSIADFFNRASYLCKAATKHYGNGVHSFGASRR